jgi:hypothetical protein
MNAVEFRHTLMRNAPFRLAPLLLIFILGTLRGSPAWADTAEFSEFVSGTDVVVTGSLERVSSLHFNGSNPCTSDSVSPINATRYTVRIDSVLAGSVGATTILITSLGRTDLEKFIGARVIAYADRICPDASSLWGDVMPVLEDGTMKPRMELRLTGFKMGEPILYDSAIAAMSRTLMHHGMRAFDGVAGVALVRLARYIRGPAPRSFSYECDSVGWVVPTSERLPRRIDWQLSDGCSPDFGPGDTLLVPIVRGSGGRDLVTGICPHPWVIDHGFSRGLGVPLSEAARALWMDQTGVHVRSILGPRTTAPTPVRASPALPRPSRGSGRSRGSG